MSTKNKSPYIPSFLKAALSDTRPLQITFGDLVQTNIKSTSSFKYEPLDSPLKNTQQLNVDWSKFENHTFFSSAEVKTNVAFEQIINGYPFDGTKIEFESFFEKLNGFEKWVFDQFPKFAGQLHFSGTQVGEDPANGFAAELGTYVVTKDVAGWLYPELSKNKSGESIINPPINSSFSIEAQIFLPDQNNDRQVVFQKQSTDMLQGITFHLEPSTDSFVTGTFSMVSGSVNNNVSAILKKGKFNHVCMVFNRNFDVNTMQFYVDEKLINESSKSKSIAAFNDRSDVFLGSGSSFIIDNAVISPQQTFSGSIDEFRLFHSDRPVLQQQLFGTKGLFTNSSLKLYYRFNEPPEWYSNDTNEAVNAIVLDSSGNSLHGTIQNYNITLRQNAALNELNPVKNERKEFKTILFPLHSEVIALNEELLTSASYYDQQNPNLITKLVPRHYLREGALEEGYQSTKLAGSLGEPAGGQGIPGQSEIGSVQIILTFLYIWSKFFDEIKMFTDAFRSLRTVNYDLDDTIPDNFLMDFVRAYGFYLPPFFNSSNVLQYVEGEDINTISVSDYSLKNVQAQLLRRVLVNMPDILRSKGTQHSIKSFLRSVGIDPDNSLRIREFGGPAYKQLGSTREVRTDVVPVVDFVTSSFAYTPFLSASRIEPGYPEPVGPFIEGISSYPSDGLLTSGSWTLEGLYRFGPQNKRRTTDIVQSLMRLETTGSSSAASTGLLLNVITSGSLQAFIRPGYSASAPLLHLELKDVNVFDGDRWSVSVGCERNDAIGSYVSSSYFLRAAKQNSGDITDYHVTASYFNDFETPGNAFRYLDSAYNSSGSMLRIGTSPSISVGTTISGYRFLNDTLSAPSPARTNIFAGQVSNVRFWSKALNDAEWREHVRNYRSFGVDDAYNNYNYVTNTSGSFERLRVRSLEKQPERMTDVLGEILFLDYSENAFHMQGTGFDPESKAYIGDIMSYSYLSPYFDEFSTNEKVRIRSFQDEELLKDAPWAAPAPVYELPAHEAPLDDPRLSIEFSLVDTLNKDIVAMFSTLDQIGNAIGSPETMFSPDYPDLEKLRNIYFNRLEEKLNFRSFFEFYRWFDLSISTFINQLVPRKTRFKGTNFVIESHMLERHKLEYLSTEIYLGDSVRSRMRDVLLLQQAVGKISRY
jgi:hypothetical protein